MSVKNLFEPVIFYEKDGGNGGGDAAGNDTPPGNEQDSDPGGDGDVKFTAEQQEAIDKILGTVRRDASQKARDKALEELLKPLEIDDPEQLAAIVKMAREAEAANKSEVEKLSDQIDRMTKKVSDTEASSSALVKAANLRVLKSEIKLAAAAAGIRTEALVDVPALLNLDDLLETFDEETESFGGVKAAIEKLANEKEYLLADETDAPPGTPPRGKKPKGKKYTPDAPLVRM